MTDPKQFVRKTQHNLNLLQEREAKYAGNPPLDLVNQIEDHREAIRLTQQLITGEIPKAEWQEQLKALNLATPYYLAPDPEIGLPAPEQLKAHRTALIEKVEYRRWADESTEEHFIPEESRLLPLLASPYEDDSGQQREDLLQTIRAHDRLLVLGEPGMGKTVTMHRMMWETARTTEPER